MRDESMNSQLNGRTLAILGFHKIGEPPPGGWASWFYVPETVFASQLRHLHENGWQLIDIGRFLKGLLDPESLPSRGALLTLDDGYRSNLQVAIPWLQRFGYPSVMFVPIQFIGGHNLFDDGSEPLEDICDWGDFRELESRPCSIQSHGGCPKSFSPVRPARH